MERKFSWIVLGLILTLGLLLASCAKPESNVSPSTSSNVPLKSTTSSSAAGNWWDTLGAPQYGGVINIRMAADPVTFDPYWTGTDMSLWMETDGSINWKTPPDVCQFNTNYMPMEAKAGVLAESWEQPDLQTVILHLRKNVYWQNKPPVNGRQFVASDVVYTFDRNFGLGNGFTKSDTYRPNPSFSALQSVTATDNFTVVFKFNQPSLDYLTAVLDYDSGNCIVPPEGNTAIWRCSGLEKCCWYRAVDPSRLCFRFLFDIG